MKRKALVIAVLVLGLSVANAVPALAWTNPSANPATGGGSVVAEQNSPANALYIKSDGNIGIGGVTVPAEKLDVGGNIKTNGTIKVFNGATQVGEITTTDTTWFRLNQNIAKNIYTPQYFRADGGLYVDDTSHGINGSGVLVSASLSGTYSSAVTLSSATNSFTGSTISTSGASYLATTSGNVGVGTATANSKLTVAGTIESTSGGVKFPDGTTQATAASGATISAANVSSGAFGSNVGGGDYSFPGKLAVGSGVGSNVLDLRSAANNINIGLGSTTQTNYSNMTWTTDTGNVQIWKGGSTYSGYGGARSLNIYNSEDYPIVFFQGTNERLRINSGGSVGIGAVTAPAEKLDISGNLKINEYRIKRISATSMGVYDSTNTVMLEFDEGV